MSGDATARLLQGGVFRLRRFSDTFVMTLPPLSASSDRRGIRLRRHGRGRKFQRHDEEGDRTFSSQISSEPLKLQNDGYLQRRQQCTCRTGGVLGVVPSVAV